MNIIKINYVIESYNPLNPPKPILNEDGYYYYIYQITNLINGKIYAGKHKTKNLNDGYFGSGSKLKEDYKIFNKEKDFRKDILAYLTSEDEMDTLEESLVSLEFCNRNDTYNVVPGGKGGQYYVTSMGGIACKKRYENDPKFKEEVNKKRSESLKKFFNSYIYTDDIRKKISENNHKAWSKLKFKYMYNLELKQCRPIPEKDQSKFIDIGWKFGRINFSKYKNNEKETFVNLETIYLKRKEKKVKQKKIKNSIYNSKNLKRGENFIYVYNEQLKVCLKIRNSELDIYLSKGFIKGRGIVGIHNNKLNKAKYIFKHELQEYLDNDWELGRTLPKNSPNSLICITNVITKEHKQIKFKDKDKYLSYGWILGYKKN